MKSISFHGARVAYAESGKGQPLLFLHNGGNDHRIWDYQLEYFSRSYRVIAPDHIGYGESDKPAGLEYTLPLYTEMVGALVDQLGLAPVALVGHCIGAAMAINYARLHPADIRCVIAFNVATEKTLLAGPLADQYREFSQSHAERDKFCTAAEAQAVTPAETAQSLQMQLGDAPGEDAAFAEHLQALYNRPGQRTSLYNNLSNFASFAVLDEFVKPSGFPPLLLIWGLANQILPESAGAELARRLAPDRFERLAHCGHLAMREEPERVNRLIEQFLKEHAVGEKVGY
jgi:pimeloyl-ACP methyl ester carboxylesterase